MKKPLQALLIAPDDAMRRNIEIGRKCITIREGHRDYCIGPVVLCCHIDPWCIMANITDVSHTTLANVSANEIKADGFSSHEDALSRLRRFYPSITLDSEVTVIRWENVRGKLVTGFEVTG